MDDNLLTEIKRFALINALQYGGKANSKAVLGKVLGTYPELRSNVKSVLLRVEKVVNEVNKIPIDEQRKALENLGGEEWKKEKKQKEKQLPPLPEVDKFSKVVMRLAPFPSGPLHIGNARMVILNDEYIRMYKGTLILAYDDTIGSKDKPIISEAYDLIKEGLEWLGVKWHKTIYKSDRVEIFYKYAKKLIEMGKAYVCTCNPDVFRKEYKAKKRVCPHRNTSIEENLEKWDKMLAGEYKEKEAVLRLKTGMNLENPAIRDVPIMRISIREHPRVGTKYVVWPLLEFNWSIDDHLLGITHILRGKDLIKEDIIESFIWDVFGWPKSVFVHYGRIRFKGISLSKSYASKMIREGKYFGWDDPRVWSLQSLKSRGIFPEALRKVILSMGLSLTDIEFAPETLYAENRRIIDPIANRYFCVIDPIKIVIMNLPFSKKEVKIQRHPDFPKRGLRTIKVHTINKQAEVLISEGDWKVLQKNSIVRLKDFVNIKIVSKENKVAEYHSDTVDEGRKVGAKIIHWIPSDTFVSSKIVMPDGQIKKGFAEENVKELKKGSIVQFERFGFVKIHDVNPLFSYYAHP